MVSWSGFLSTYVCVRYLVGVGDQLEQIRYQSRLLSPYSLVGLAEPRRRRRRRRRRGNCGVLGLMQMHTKPPPTTNAMIGPPTTSDLRPRMTDRGKADEPLFRKRRRPMPRTPARPYICTQDSSNISMYVCVL